MNEHIRKGNQALKKGDLEVAKSEFYEALSDSDYLVQRIARNRLMELFPETVWASSHSIYYHRPNCTAKNITKYRRVVNFQTWEEAEAADYKPCQMCKPPQVKPRSEI